MKKNKVPSNDVVGWGHAYVVYEHTPERIVGKLMGIIEAAGLPSRQEEAIKGMIKEHTYNVFHEGSIWITPERHSEIRHAYLESRNQDGVPLPLGAI